MPCSAKHLERDMIVKYAQKTLTVEYSKSASYDFSWVKFKEIDKETLQKAYEKFEVIVNEEYVDRNRNEFGGVPLWCTDATGKMKYGWIDKIKI